MEAQFAQNSPVKTRNCMVDFWRFVGAIIIMIHHVFYVDGENIQPILSYGWILVEFFFMLTGYYTVRHFSEKKNLGRDVTRNSLEYTLNKYIPFLPLNIVTTIISAIPLGVHAALESGLVGDFFNYVKDIPFDFVFISESFTMPYNVPTWYLAAIFLVFPFFCMFVQIENRHLKLILELLVPVYIYGAIGIRGDHNFPLVIFRTLAGLLLGAFIFDVLAVFPDFLRGREKLCSFAEVFFFLVPIILLIFDIDFLRLIILCFVLGLTALLSNEGLSRNISVKGFLYLGKLSTPMFFWHWPCIEVIQSINSVIYTLPVYCNIILYFAFTFAASVITLAIEENWKPLQKFMHPNIQLG